MIDTKAKADTSTNLRIIKFSNYVQPEVKEIQGKDYVTYGRKNSYFQYLIDRSRGSATNGAVINSCIDIIYGKGLMATNKAQKPNDYAQFLALLKPEDVKRCINDLKRMGQCALQIIYKGGHKSIDIATHMPIESLAPEKMNKDGEIGAYYHAFDWNKVRSARDTTRIAVFGSGETREILYIKPYNSGLFYFSTVDYHGGLQYAELEEEIGNYHVNNVQNGMAPGMIINYNNGDPGEEQKNKIHSDLQATYRGSSNTGRAMLMFNESKDRAATIEAVPLSRAAEQYQFLSDESARKILIAHRITSPLLLGLSTATGFGSNADELEMSSKMFESLVIAPFRQLFIENVNKLLVFNKLALDLEFESLNPFEEQEGEEFDSTKEGITPEAKEKQLEAQAKLRGSVGGVQGILQIQKSVVDGLTSFQSAVTMLIEIYGFKTEVAIQLLGSKTAEAGINLSGHSNLDGEIADQLISLGEDEDEENWECILTEEVDYDLEDERDKMLKLTSTGTARPNANSEQDGNNFEGARFRVRYQYNPMKVSENSREFCIKMVAAEKLYRKEDIIMMENMAVNPGWGPEGVDTYSIWFYKGGGNCHHKWFRKTFVQRVPGTPDLRSPLAETISTTKARSSGFRPEANDDLVAIAPIKMPNQGFLN